MSCAFRRCNNNKRNSSKSTGVTFHAFPRDARYKEKWTKIIQIEQRDEDWLPTRFTRVCSKHFTETDFYMTRLGRRKVKAGAFPSFPHNFKPKQNGGTCPQGSIVYISAETPDSLKGISLKEELEIEKQIKEEYKMKIVKLSEANRYFRARNRKLEGIVKTLKKKILLLSKDNEESISNYTIVIKEEI